MTNDESDKRPWAAYGWIIIIGSLAAVGGMAVHPTGGPNILENVRNLVENGGFNSAVHFFLIATYLVLILGFVGLSEWLGIGKLAVRGGLIAYCASTAAATAPAAVGKAAWTPSPRPFTITPSWEAMAARMMWSWRAMQSCIASGCSSQSRVEPSMSENRKVTVPAGKPVMAGRLPQLTGGCT